MPLTEIDRRITFHDDIQVMEVDFSGYVFEDSVAVNRFYDRLEERIAQSGEDYWFFLVNLCDTRIDSSAWFTYAMRGKELNLAHSMGSVRFDASDITRRQIERAANTEAFDPNLFVDRDAALARLASMPSTRRMHTQNDATYTVADFQPRITFDPELLIMEADFSHFTFHHSRDVDDFYDHIEDRIRETGRKWFFLVNLNGCRILPAAAVQYAKRGKIVNLAAAHGSVRFAAGAATEREIRMRAETQNFSPNIYATREEALARIAEMRARLETEFA